MATTLKAIDLKKIDAHFDCGQGVFDGGTFLQHDTAGGLEHLDNFLDQAGSLDDAITLVNSCLRVTLKHE